MTNKIGFGVEFWGSGGPLVEIGLVGDPGEPSKRQRSIFAIFYHGFWFASFEILVPKNKLIFRPKIF